VRIFNGKPSLLITLYVLSRKLCLDTQDYEVVKRLLEEAKAAGGIERVEASLPAIASHKYLRVTLNELRCAGEHILRNMAQFMRQADVELPICDLQNGFERFKSLQKWAQLATIILASSRLRAGLFLAVGD
jgi:hypothetical protein